MGPLSRNLETEKIRKLDEELLGIINEAAPGTDDLGAGSRCDQVDVLGVAVITKEEGGAGVDQVGDQEVRVKILGGLERGQLGASKYSVVL